MYDKFSTNFLESYTGDHYADLLAEAEKARLIKESLVYLTPRQASRTRDVQFMLRNILIILASNISRILSRSHFFRKVLDVGTTISLAIIAKAELVFEGENKYLNFPVSPIIDTTDQLRYESGQIMPFRNDKNFGQNLKKEVNDD